MTGTTENTTSTAPSTAPNAPAPTSVAPTAVSTPVASPAAPAAPAAPPTPPATALEALERAAANLEADSSSAAPGAREAGATPDLATVPARSGITPPAKPEAPESRIERAVTNAREQVRAESQAKYGWVDQHMQSRGIDRAEFDRRLALADRLLTDPQGFYRQLGAELQVPNPASPAPVAEPEFVDPEPDLRSEDGRAAFSDKTVRQLVTNAVERAKRDMKAEFAPALEFATEGRSWQEQQAIRAEATETARQVMAEVTQLPFYATHKKDIEEAFRNIPPAVLQRVGSVAALHMAINKVVVEKVLPAAGAQQAQRTVADLQRSAIAGSTAVSVAPAAPPTPKIREGNLDDLSRHLAEVHGRMAAT